MIQAIDSKCDKCEQIADWRLRSNDGLYIYAAACKTHKDEIRTAIINKLRSQSHERRIAHV